MPNNPFETGPGREVVDAPGRLDKVSRFSLEECRAALTVKGLQKEVRRRLEARIRRLEKL